jgi:multiple sugar transport system permease protein
MMMKPKTMKWKNRGKPLVIILTVGLLLVMLFPFFVMITTMLRSGQEVYVSPPRWIPQALTLRNFVVVWTQYLLAGYFKSSAIIAVGATALNLLLSIPAAYAIARLRFKGRQLALYLFLVVQMFSPVVVVISLFKTFSKLGLLDSYLGLIVINAVFSMAFSIWLLSGYFKSIPIEIEEAAFIDGATRRQTVLRIILPIAAPGLVTTSIYTFIAAWNEFLFALSFIQSQTRMPLTLGLYRFVGRWSSQWELLTTAAFLAIIPVLVLFYVIQQRLVAGLAGGAVKG